MSAKSTVPVLAAAASTVTAITVVIATGLVPVAFTIRALDLAEV